MARDATPVCGPNELAGFQAALVDLNMMETDPGFTKDVAEPRQALQWIRDGLKSPMLLPQKADEILAGAVTDTWSLACNLLELPLAASNEEEIAGDDAMWEGLDPELVQILSRFLASAHRANALLDHAFAKLSLEEKSYLAASELAGVFNAEDHADVRGRLRDSYIATNDVTRVIDEMNALDPEPAATNYLALLQKIDRSALLAAGKVFQRAVREVYDRANGIKNWPEGNMMVVTDLGKVRIATRANETYSDECLLILEPGGKNIYDGKAGSASGLDRQHLCAIVDLGGDDEYANRGLLSPGAALFGLSVILDASGDDVYRAAFLGQAAAVHGVAWLEDFGGDDTYVARGLSQAASVGGLAYLQDHAGNDTYTLGYEGQAFAGVNGFSLLIDDEGQDRYAAGGVERDFERNDDRFISLAQGFAIGMRSLAGGGVAALIDKSGNDIYEADVYGQGASYWYSAGFLIDEDGFDSYRVYQYGQGSGIHLSLGLLADFAGDDEYLGGILTQGNAHDYAVGMLFDHAGRDTYTASANSQGQAMNNAFAFLCDSAGDDAYFARDGNSCQGIGNSGWPRDYGSLAVLLDLDGHDSYSCGAINDNSLLRPLYGVIFDSALPAAKHK